MSLLELCCLLAFVLVFYSFSSLPFLKRNLHFVPFLKRGGTELKNGDFVPANVQNYP